MRGTVFVVAAAAVLVVGACVGDAPATSSDGGDSGASGAISCKAGDTCASGTCVDGFCCNTPCDGQCEACDVSGHEGTCTPVTGKPHHVSCSGDADGPCAGSCDGTKTDACSYPSSSCGAPASCAAGVAQLQAVCSNGTCGSASTQTCKLGCFQDTCLGVQQVAGSRSFACAVLTDGRVRCWGDNSRGELGLESVDQTNYPNPVDVFALDGSKVTSVGAAAASACAVLAGGTIECWGDNLVGELGSSTGLGSFNATPTLVQNVSGATFVSSGSSSRFCAIVGGGGVRCWGSNSSGALGSGKTAAMLASTEQAQVVCAPGQTSLPCTAAAGATFVSVGDNHACGIFSGKVACWGANERSELGFPADGVDHPFATIVSGIDNATTVTTGNGVSCATTSDGKAYCWGGNSGGTLGIGNNNTPVSVPTEVCSAQDCSTHLSGLTAISTYDDVACALAGGAVKCWGSNSLGQLGDGTSTPNQNFAASTAVASGVVQISNGGETTWAVFVDGAERNLKCWGQDDEHQCADGADAGTSTNVPVLPEW